ncbi:hypothetical protein AA14337_3143 [Acetobacter malorum DSM 14337]|uniref:Uncharacterized protein n=2 Tax=Acetobacter malorum TaxID=178901 RepID=A0ABQ0PZW8_9PROT|nr:hypothetical protein AA14337_3143 [Acetobacter malorum DSM 14337]
MGAFIHPKAPLDKKAGHMAYAYSIRNMIYFNTNEYETVLIIDAIRAVLQKDPPENTWIAFLRRYVEQGDGLSGLALVHMNNFLAKDGCKGKQVTLRPTKVPYCGPDAKGRLAADRRLIFKTLTGMEIKKKSLFLQEQRRGMGAEPETPEFDPTFDDQEALFKEYAELVKRLSGPKPITPAAVRAPLSTTSPRQPTLSLSTSKASALRLPDPLDQPEISSGGEATPFAIKPSPAESVAEAAFPHQPGHIEQAQPFIPDGMGWPTYEEAIPQPDFSAPKTASADANHSNLSAAISWMESIASMIGNNGPVRTHIDNMKLLQKSLAA